MKDYKFASADRVRLIDILLSVGLFIIFVPFIYYRVGGLPSVFIIIFWFAVTWRKDFRLLMNNPLTSKTLIWIILWTAIVAYYQFYIYGAESKMFIVIPMQTVIWSYVFWFISQYYIITKRFNRLKSIIVMTLYSLLVSSITQLIALMKNPLYSRMITGKGAASSLEMALVDDAYKLGVGGYDIIYGIILLSVPILFAFLQSKPPIRNLLLIVGILLLVTGLKASYMIGTLSILLAILIVIAFKQKFIKPVYFITLSVILVYLNMGEIGNWVATHLDKIYTIFNPSELNVYKIENMLLAIQDSIYGGTTRYDEYSESIGGFMKNPLFGDAYGSCGGHSALFDSLSRFGILGTIPWIMIVYCFQKQMNQMLYKNCREKILLSYVFLVPWIFTMIVNPTNSRTVYAAYFLIVPGISLFVIENDKENSIGSK